MQSTANKIERVKNYVYIMHEPSPSGRMLVKVGISDDPKRRLRENTTGSPYDLVLRSSFFCGGQARRIEKLTHDEFCKYRTKRRGEWFSADVEQIESFVVSLVRYYCGYDPLIDVRISQERKRYAEIMGSQEVSEDYDSCGGNSQWQVSVHEGRLLARRLKLARDLPVEVGDMPFVEWYVSYWLPLDFWTCGLEQCGFGDQRRILNVDDLIAVLTSDGFYQDHEIDQIPGYMEIVDRVLDLWDNYKNVRSLSEKELKMLLRHFNGFLDRWFSTEYDRTQPLPCQTVAGRSMSLSGGSLDDTVCTVHLGFGVRLRVRFDVSFPELLYPGKDRKRRVTIRLSDIKDAWVESRFHGVTRDRHVAVIKIREMVLDAFLRTQCISCFDSCIPNVAIPDGSFFAHLSQSIYREAQCVDRWPSRTRSLFRTHAEELKFEVMRLTTEIWRLFTSTSELKAEIETCEFDGLDENNIGGIDVVALMRTIAYGRSWKGDQLARQQECDDE